MTISNEMIFYAGLAIISFTVLVAAVAVPTFILMGSQLKKQLETTYGNLNHKKISECGDTDSASQYVS